MGHQNEPIDSYALPNGCASGQMRLSTVLPSGQMEEFIAVPIRLTHSPELQERILAFRRRADDLAEFIRSKKWGQHHVSIDRNDENSPKISGTLPDELILEGLYRRYRFFILNHEKSNYRRLVNLLSQNTDSERLQKYFRSVRREFLEEDILRAAFITARKKIRPEQVIDYWFNAYYFHGDEKKHEQLETFRQVMTDNGAKLALWHVVWRSALRVRNLAYLLRETSEEYPYVYMPKDGETFG